MGFESWNFNLFWFCCVDVAGDFLCSLCGEVFVCFALLCLDFLPFPLTVEWISDTQNTVIDPARLYNVSQML